MGQQSGLNNSREGGLGKRSTPAGSTLSYASVITRLEQALQFGINPSLDGIRALTEKLGRPQDAFRPLQITGTNGKTSVTRMTAAILAAHGECVGAYTSPHLVSYCERIEIDGWPASEPSLLTRLRQCSWQRAAWPPLSLSFSRLRRCGSWRERGVTVACLEVGMGGRWERDKRRRTSRFGHHGCSA